MTNDLCVKNVSAERDGRTIVRDVTFSVSEGELVAIVGKNGVGKSTLLSAIAGDATISVTCDELSFSGIDMLLLSADKRAALGLFLVHQEPPALFGLSLEALLRAGLPLVDPSLSIADIESRLRDALLRVSLPREFAKRPLFDGFSGGEKKKAELVLMLAYKPRCVLVDEIDSGLDAATRAIVVDIFAELRCKGVICVVVSHNADFVSALTPTRTVALQEGVSLA